MPLTDKQVQNARPTGDRVAKLSDGGGLQLWLTPSDGKLWNLAYRFAGRQRKLSIGPYPSIPLKEARTRRDEAKRQLDVGLDPSQQKRLAKLAVATQQANTFASIAVEFLDKERGEGKAAATLSKLEWLIGIAKPTLGPRPITEIAAPEVLNVLRLVEARERRESAKRLRAVIGAVFRYAIATGRATNDPTAALKGALIRRRGDVPQTAGAACPRVGRSVHPHGDVLVFQPIRRQQGDPRPLSQSRAVRRRDAKPSSSSRSLSVKTIETEILPIAILRESIASESHGIVDHDTRRR